MKKRLRKALRLLLSGFSGVFVFALFIWQGFWIAVGRVIAGAISAGVAAFVYDSLA